MSRPPRRRTYPRASRFPRSRNVAVGSAMALRWIWSYLAGAYTTDPRVHLEGSARPRLDGLFYPMPGTSEPGSGRGSQIVTRTGVGFSPVQGLLTWGQFEIRVSASISARRST